MIHTLKYNPADVLHYTLTESLHHGNWEIRRDHSKICGKQNTIQTLEGSGFRSSGKTIFDDANITWLREFLNLRDLITSDHLI